MKEDFILNIENLSISLVKKKENILLVNNVNLQLFKNKITVLIGESGSGKTLLVKSILNFLTPPIKRTSGKIFFLGKDISNLSSDEYRILRKDQISMIFQNPQNSLNPLLKIGEQLLEASTTSELSSDKEKKKEIIQLMDKIVIEDSLRVFNSFPFELSGGMCQKIMIVISFLKRPKLILADEPTTSLDMPIQAEILKQLVMMKNQLETSIFLITHDLRVVAEIADYVYIMKDGEIVEFNDVYSIFKNPKHDYTKALLSAI